MGIANIDVFQESVTIASACNKVLRKPIFKTRHHWSDSYGQVYRKQKLQSKSYDVACLQGTDGRMPHTSQQERAKIQTARTGNFQRGRLLCGNKTVYEFNGCYCHGHSCQPFRDTPTVAGDTLAERYEKTMARLAKINEAGYQVVVQWECEFDKGIVAAHPELEHIPSCCTSRLILGTPCTGVELKP
jgi:hypothetical protein